MLKLDPTKMMPGAIQGFSNKRKAEAEKKEEEEEKKLQEASSAASAVKGTTTTSSGPGQIKVYWCRGLSPG